VRKRLLQHIAFWLLYLAFEVYVEFAWISSSFETLSWQGCLMIALYGKLVSLVLIIPMCYLVFYLMSLYYEKKNTALSTVAALSATFIIGVHIYRVFAAYIILPYIYHRPVTESFYNINRLISAVVNILFIAGIAFAVKQYRHRLRWREVEKNLTNEKLVAELKFLKAQTNPHFLFNTLNNIYALARKNSDKTADVVMKLSTMLRYMLYETNTEKTEIANEVKIINDYLELEKLRYNNRLRIEFNNRIDNQKEAIAPLILLPFVENAFKHGAGESRFESYILIDLTLIDGRLNFTIINSKEYLQKKTIIENIGLRNIRRQLELTYPVHELVIENSNKEFIVKLKINLNERKI